VVQSEKNVQGLAVADGKLLWQIPAPTQGRVYNSATPIIEGQTVYYTGQGKGTRAVKIEKQGETFATKELWSNPQLGTGFNTPVLKNGLLFGLTERGNLFCLNAQDGQTAWSDTTRRENFMALLDAGSVLIALPEKSGLLVFKPSNKEYQEIAQIKVSETPIYASPVLSGKRIFTKDKETVTLWTVE
jgi:outer membrane protein assembly factor BamB